MTTQKKVVFFNEKKEDIIKQYEYETNNSDRKYIECKCPTCQEIHIKYIFWTGRGIPNIRCSICKASTSTISE